MPPPPRLWVELVRPASPPPPEDLAQGPTGPLVARDRAVDLAGCLCAAVLGALFLSPILRSGELATTRVAVDLSCGVLACASLWWRRRWAIGVALGCLLLGTLSVSATPAGLLALFSLAVHRSVRPTLFVTALWVPSILVFALYSSTTDALSVLVRVTPLVLAVTAWGMFIRARRQLLQSLRDRALRAEADQRQHEEQARLAERTRIAREMHDVLAHRISLLALHAGALEVRPDLPPAQVRETAELLRSTARQALEELRTVIGVLREVPGADVTPAVPQPTLVDLGRLIQETRDAGMEIEFDLRVDHLDAAPAGVARDAYRIVQEALTNVGKHALDAAARVRVTGGPDRGLHLSIRNRQPVPAQTMPTLPGSGAGLLGLQERVDLAGGTLVHGFDGSGDFVVEVELPWRP
jgi:signal transduction histidine kinase